MKKAKAVERAPKQIPDRTPPSMVTAIKAVKLKPLLDVRSNLASIDRQIGSYKRGAKDYIEKRKELTEKEKELKRGEKSIEDLAKRRADHAIAQLAKHVGVQKITSEGDGAIVIETPLIFTDIRSEGGERDGARACIGAFDIYINTKPNPRNGTRLKITNKIFDPKNLAYGHWGIKRGVPCLGEWQTDISKAQEEGDYYRIFDTMYHYLKESEQDGGAYMRSHGWRNDYRRIDQTGPQYKKYARGSYVICIQEHDGNDRIVGKVGRVVNEGSISVGVLFRSDIGGAGYMDMADNAKHYPSHHWSLPARSDFLIEIPEELYKRRTFYGLGRFTKKPQIKQLDKMSDGTTYGEAMREIGKSDVSIEMAISDLMNQS